MTKTNRDIYKKFGYRVQTQEIYDIIYDVLLLLIVWSRTPYKN